MSLFLGRAGYSVATAETAADAREQFNASPGQFDLVIADLTLPDGSGEELAMEMASRSPDVRVLICSGYPHTLDNLPDAMRERFDVLQKPFVPDALSKSVADLLARGAA